MAAVAAADVYPAEQGDVGGHPPQSGPPAKGGGRVGSVACRCRRRSRFLSDRPHRGLYFWHYAGNRLLTLVSNAFTNLNLTDMETCYKTFRKEVLDSIEVQEDRFGIEPEITAKVAAGGWRIYEVGISYHGRTYAEGKRIGWRDGLAAFRCIVRYSDFARRWGAVRS